jgi:hypothetical protein
LASIISLLHMFFATFASTDSKISYTGSSLTHHGGATKGIDHPPQELTAMLMHLFARGGGNPGPLPGLWLPSQPQTPKEGGQPTRFFNQVQPKPRPSQPAPSASVVMPTMSMLATPRSYGMDLLPIAKKTRTADPNINLNPAGTVLCSDWQRVLGCSVTTHDSKHECSGCGKPTHGAQKCPRAQEA